MALVRQGLQVICLGADGLHPGLNHSAVMQSRFLRRFGHLGKGLLQCLHRFIQAIAACAEGIRQARLRLAGKTCGFLTAMPSHSSLV